MSRLHVFVDNSNVWIEGKKVAGRRSRPAVPSNRLYRIDYGRLLEHVRDGRPLAGPPKLYGSEPPPNDSVWRVIENQGFDVQVFKRNVFNREKGVDMKMGLDIGGVFFTTPEPATIAIVAGDGDFLPVVEMAHERGWQVEVWYWSNVAHELRGAADRYEDLDPEVYTIGFDA